MELFEHPEFSYDDFIKVYSLEGTDCMKVVSVKNKRWSNYITIFDRHEDFKILSCKKKRRYTVSDENYLKNLPLKTEKLTFKIISNLYDLDEKI